MLRNFYQPRVMFKNIFLLGRNKSLFLIFRFASFFEYTVCSKRKKQQFIKQCCTGHHDIVFVEWTTAIRLSTFDIKLYIFSLCCSLVRSMCVFFIQFSSPITFFTRCIFFSSFFYHKRYVQIPNKLNLFTNTHKYLIAYKRRSHKHNQAASKKYFLWDFFVVN